MYYKVKGIANVEKVDILLATYNGARFLREQLDSILTGIVEKIK